MNTALWIVQVLLALLFLFTGEMKLILPIAEMTKQMPMPGLFLRFLGVAEILGAVPQIRSQRDVYRFQAKTSSS